MVIAVTKEARELMADPKWDDADWRARMAGEMARAVAKWRFIEQKNIEMQRLLMLCAAGMAGIATEALTAAGYHILSDAELAARDNAVLEKAARRARECFDDEQAEADPAYVPSAIRALGRKA